MPSLTKVADLATAEFDYELPPSAIAQTPVEPRDAARLLVDEPGGVQHRTVADLPSLLAPGDLLVVNDTKVLPARLHLRKPTGGAVEVLLLEPTGDAVQSSAATIAGSEWQALVRPGKRLRVGTILELDGAPVLEITGQLDDGRRLVQLLDDGLLERAGEMPLPPYITERLADPSRYQTIYADQPGSVAAPTAGLHLTDEVFAGLAQRGIEVAKVELRVGLGTFRPISTDVVSEHVMHRESYRIEPDVWKRIQAAPRVVAVGTTVVRTLESAAASGELAGATELFISRGFDWQVVDRMLTNFHVPRSSLLVMIDAFVGQRWKDLYAEALTDGYRFLSFGDASLLDRGRR
ncbi:MAG: S-adenosylmethionine:tRNA ribosyltransferase-isomerase [Acidimicrobiales bacterium]|jgi:S-adenosylmethionine:tRNA ribosyltransferase-isomerase